MIDENALLQAVRDDPEDDALRLVYADWLEEHGDLDRAELIRVQCALAQPRLARSRRERLRTREQELLQLHRERWLGKLRRSPLPWVFHRGFVERLAEAGAFRTTTQRYKDETYCDCIRFFPDGRLLCHCLCPAPDTLRQIERRMQWRNLTIPRGKYALCWAAGRMSVSFEIPCGILGPDAVTRYDGVIQGIVMRLNYRHGGNGPLNRAQYRWCSFKRAR